VNAIPASPKNLHRLLGYAGAAVLLACLMSPPLYWVGTWLAAQGVLPIVEGFPFHRYFSRSMQIATLLLLWPAFRGIGIRRLSSLGLSRNPQAIKDITIGSFIALLPVLVLASAYVFWGVYEMKPRWEWSGFLRIGGTAAVVAVLEEFLFRGVFLGLCLMTMHRLTASALSAAVFAIVHFLRTSRQPLEAPVTWLSGFQEIPLAFSSAPPWPLFGWGFLSLFIAGVLLAAATLRTRSLFLAIGIHAGWILGQQSLQLIARFHPKPPTSLLPWIGPNVVSGAVPTGLVPAAVLLATGLLLWIFLHHAARDRRFS
jgi:membrane protease YdiL (CAAX protease family)